MNENMTLADMLALMRETRESIQVMFQETDRKFQETDRKFQETNRMFQDTDREFQETRLILKESQERTDASARELRRQMGNLGNKLGSVVEHMLIPGIEEKFNELGYTFENISTDMKMKDSSGNTYAELDIVLENGEYVMLIEVKTDLKIEDVKNHSERLQTIRRRGRKWQDKKLLGAVSAAIVENNVRDYAKKNGFFVISQSGDTMRIDKPEGRC
jgi:hypothetical protein